MPDVKRIQSVLREFQLDGWLLYEFRGSNPLAQRILGIENVGTRRCFYFIPAEGEPRKLVHRIEAAALAHLPGTTTLYLSWQQLRDGVAAALQGAATVAMEYSPEAANPYVSRVDAGTVELVRACGSRVVSSGDLVQQFEATWNDRQWELHQVAAEHTNRAFQRAWKLIAEKAIAGTPARETEVQAAIVEYLHGESLITGHPPIVAADSHSGDPHFEPSPDEDRELGRGVFVLIDLWGKVNDDDGVYSDLTRVAYVGETVPESIASVFAVVAQARDAVIARLRDAFSAGRSIAGWELDQVARDVISAAGYGDHFIHRTGHSIGGELHGNGANLDNLETKDERQILPRTGFSVEPGIYLDDFGIRSETNIYVDGEGHVHVTCGQLQSEVLALLA